jgi:hypothetical protein
MMVAVVVVVVVVAAAAVVVEAAAATCSSARSSAFILGCHASSKYKYVSIVDDVLWPAKRKIMSLNE